MIMRIANITVTPSAKVVLTMQTGIDFDDNRPFDFQFCYNETLQTTQVDKITGTEQVFVQSGSTGAEIPMWDGIGNCFFAGKLVRGRWYRNVFGNNGYPTKVAHLLCRNAPYRGFYNPAGNDTPQIVI